MNFHELKRPEAAIHYFLRFVAAKALVGYGMDIMLNVFSICNGIVTDMADSMGGISEVYGVAARRNADRYRKCGISRQHTAMARNDSRQLVHYGAFLCNDPYRVWPLLPLVYVHSAGSAAAGGFCRGKHTIRGHIVLKSYVGVCLEGAVIVLACVIYSAFVSTPTVTSGEATTIVWSYLAETVFNMLVICGANKRL